MLKQRIIISEQPACGRTWYDIEIFLSTTTLISDEQFVT